MGAPIPVTLALGPGADRAMAEAFVSDARLQWLDELDVTSDAEPVGDVIVLASASTDEESSRFAERVVERAGRRPVVLICPSGSNGFAGHLVGTGFEDVVVVPEECSPEVARALSGQLVFTIQKVLSRRTPASAIGGKGRLIVTLGLKGGSGKTLTSTNLAVALADAGKSVAIVDVDLQFGDIALALGLTPDSTIYDLIRSGGALDEEKLDAYLLRHPTGVRALMAPLRPDQAGLVTPDFLREVCGLLRGMFDFVVVDTPPGFTPEVIACVDASTDICMVGALDSLSLKNTKLALETLGLMEYEPERVTLVLNRADSKVGIDAQDVERVLGRVPNIFVPSDRTVTRSVNEGVPIAINHRRTDAAKAFHALAAHFTGGGAAPAWGAGVDKPKAKRSRRFAILSRSN